MYGYIPFRLFDSPQHTQYCLQKTLQVHQENVFLHWPSQGVSGICYVSPMLAVHIPTSETGKHSLVLPAALLLIPISPLLQNSGGFGSTLWPFATISHLLPPWPLIFLERMLRYLHTHGPFFGHTCGWTTGVWRAQDPQCFTELCLTALPRPWEGALHTWWAFISLIPEEQILNRSLFVHLFLPGVNILSVIQLLFSFGITNYISWLKNKCPISSGN